MFCPAVCKYCVKFSDGTVMYPSIPGYLNVYDLANQYATQTLSKNGNIVTLVSILRIY